MNTPLNKPLNKPFIRPISKTGWWLKNPRYIRYMAREVTCVFIGALAVLMVVALHQLAAGQAAFESFTQSLQSPWIVFMLLWILIFSVYNATTWFNVTPKALPVQIGEEFLDGKYIVGAHYAAWAVVSVIILWLAGVL